MKKLTDAEKRQNAKSRLQCNSEIIIDLIAQGRTVQLSPSRSGMKILHFKPTSAGVIDNYSIPDENYSEGVRE